MACRLCLNKPVEFLEIFKDNGELVEGGAKEIIEKYFQIQITFNDEISNKICLVCWRYLNEFHKFWLNIKEKQQTLQIAFDCMRMKREASEDNAYRQINATLDGKNNILCEPELNIEDIKGEENVAVDFDDDSMNEDPSLLLPKDSDGPQTRQNEFYYIKRQLDVVLSRLDDQASSIAILLNTQTENSLMMMEMVDRVKKKVRFPICNMNELEEIEEDVQKGKDLYVSNIRNIIGQTGVTKGMTKLLSDDVIIQLNYDGVRDKVPFKKFTCLNNAIYEAIQNEGYTRGDYERDLKRAFKMAKNRYHKASFLKKQRTIQETLNIANQCQQENDSIDQITGD